MGGTNEKDRRIQQLLLSEPKKGFRLLFDEYHMPLCIYVVQLTDSFQLAEDIVQDFFVAFWEKKYYLTITSNFRNYLFTAVHHAAIAVLKKKNLVSLEELTGVQVEFPDDTKWEKEELERRQQELMRRMEKLPRQELAAIRSVILENKKCVEAALELGVSVNTLKTHLSRGLRKLREEQLLMDLLIFLI